MNIEGLRRTERDAILDYVLYTMDQGTRHKLMQQFPMQYNRMCGQEIMSVKRAES